MSSLVVYLWDAFIVQTDAGGKYVKFNDQKL